MLLSEYIQHLQNQLNEYGDAPVYQIDECGCKENPSQCQARWDRHTIWAKNDLYDLYSTECFILN